jgi:hypothetical protein
MRSTRWMVPALTLTLAASAAVASAQYYGQPGPPPPPPGYGQGGWDQAPQEFRDAMRRGFHDGVEGARRDYQNHRPPNVNNRDEFRNPKFIAPPDRHDYREGFRRGYDVAVRHIYGGNPNPYNRPY